MNQSSKLILLIRLHNVNGKAEYVQNQILQQLKQSQITVHFIWEVIWEYTELCPR